jgi:hypothetical protein
MNLRDARSIVFPNPASGVRNTSTALRYSSKENRNTRPVGLWDCATHRIQSTWTGLRTG